MKFRIVCLIALISLAFCSTGFVCATRVEQMEADIAALQLQFAEIQKRVNNDQTQLTEMILRADRKLEELGSSQNETHDQVSQQNVQLALELEQSRNELAAMRGRLDVQQKALEEMQSSMQSVMSSMSSTSGGSGVILPNDQESLYRFIEENKAAGKADVAYTAMLEYIRRYPSDERNEKLLPQVAASLAANGDHREAITYGAKYLQQFPTGESRNEIIYILGDSGLKVGNCDLAKKSFATLQALNYKDAAARAKEAASCK
jgi:TolA-binding protein